jgi:hypothetical protein
MLGDVEHTTKVTNLGKGWGVRVFVNGEVNQEEFVRHKDEIGPSIRSMLRMEDKCGNISDMASAARMRPGIKRNKRLDIYTEKREPKPN